MGSRVQNHSHCTEKFDANYQHIAMGQKLVRVTGGPKNAITDSTVRQHHANVQRRVLAPRSRKIPETIIPEPERIDNDFAEH